MGAQNGQRGFPQMGQFGGGERPGDRSREGALGGMGARPGPSMGGGQGGSLAGYNPNSSAGLDQRAINANPSGFADYLSGGGQNPFGQQAGSRQVMGPSGAPISVGQGMYPSAGADTSGFNGGGMSGGGMQVKPPDPYGGRMFGSTDSLPNDNAPPSGPGYGTGVGPIFQQRKPTFGGMPAPQPIGGSMGGARPPFGQQGYDGQRASPFGNRADLSRLFRQR